VADQRPEDDFRTMQRPAGRPPSHNAPPERPATPPEPSDGASRAQDGEDGTAADEASQAPREPQKAPPNLDGGPRLGKLFGMKGDERGLYGTISDRLRGLRDPSLTFDEAEDADAEPEAKTAPQLRAEITFTAGPRAGESLTIDQGSVALDREAQPLPDGSHSRVAISIWSQGPRFMLRHSGGVAISGARPSLPVVTLDDGDEIAFGPHRLRFRLEDPAPPSA
jgi:hypothetical protein